MIVMMRVHIRFDKHPRMTLLGSYATTIIVYTADIEYLLDLLGYV